MRLNSLFFLCYNDGNVITEIQQAHWYADEHGFNPCGGLGKPKKTDLLPVFFYFRGMNRGMKFKKGMFKHGELCRFIAVYNRLKRVKTAYDRILLSAP